MKHHPTQMRLPGAFAHRVGRSVLICLVFCSALLIQCSAGQTESSSETSEQSGPAVSPGSENQSSATQRSGPEDADRGVEVVERSGMYVYSYPETLHLEDPYENYLVKRRISDGELRDEIQALLEKEEGYTPEYTARCLPVYDYGIVIVKEENRETYLFSFRCNTMHYKEKKLWKDFSPIRARLYTLLTYQINDSTSVLIDEK